MSYNGVVFFGRAGSGKTLGAQIAKRLIDEEHQGLVFNYSFAKPLKEMIGALPFVNNYELAHDRQYKTQVIPEIGTTPRRIMQTLGTEWGREIIHPDIWTIAASTWMEAIRDAEELVDTGNERPLFIIDDGRFDNEMQWAVNNDLYTILLAEDLDQVPAEHKSENIPTPEMLRLADLWLVNDRRLGAEAYEERIRRALVDADFLKR